MSKARIRSIRFGVAAGLGVLLAASDDANALDRRVRIVNESKHDIVGFYGTNVGVPDWQDNLLGAAVLRAGASIVLDFEDGSGYCRFRFRAVFDDNKELVRPSVNVCEVGTYKYTD